MELSEEIQVMTDRDEALFLGLFSADVLREIGRLKMQNPLKIRGGLR